jgi:hypothetical protein
MYADPGPLIDQLIAHTAELLNEVMALTPVERLPDVDPTTLQSGPPDDDIFGEWPRTSIRLQLGLPPAARTD